MNIDKAIRRAMPYSKCGERRLRATFAACRKVDADRIEGAFVECGVWRGGNIMIARWASPNRACWLYDTFNGMTEPGPLDMHRDGALASERSNAWAGKSAVSVNDVIENLKREDLYENCTFVCGDVRETLRLAANLPEQIAVLRLDTDFYDSTKAEMEVLYPLLAVGGVLIIDDYGHWLGARKAVADYLGKSARSLRMIDYSGAWMEKK